MAFLRNNAYVYVFFSNFVAKRKEYEEGTDTIMLIDVAVAVGDGD
jgi:hypothetical protein